ncbi:hypothetical protein G6F68_017003 [Rhizopus microsporus]|nr:hypothetical protein G6F68_017003 [Rhizopus microsporus]
MHAVDRAAGGGRGDDGEQRRRGDAEARFLAFHVAARRERGHCAVGAGLGRHGVGLLLKVGGAQGEDGEQHRHRRQDRDALAPAAHHLAEGEAQRGGDRQNRQHLQEVRQRRRVLERMRRVGVEEAAPVGAQQLDGFLRGDRAHRQRLRRGPAGPGRPRAAGRNAGLPPSARPGRG